MGSIKDRNGMDLTEAENIKNRWQEYQKNKKKAEPQGKPTASWERSMEVKKKDHFMDQNEWQ